MKTYILGLEAGGIPEKPEFTIELVREIQASSLREAKQKWAEITNHNDECWDKEKQTYWGWNVVEVNKYYSNKSGNFLSSLRRFIGL